MSRKRTTPKRGKKGLGSVYEWPKGSDHWYARLPPEYPGGPLGQRFRVGSKEEGEDLLIEKLAQRRRGIHVGTRWKLDDWIDYWLSEHVSVSRERTTYDAYESVIRLHVKPRLASSWLDELSVADIVRWQNALLRAGVSEAKVKDARSRLHKALEVAVAEEVIDRNPVTKAPSISPERRPGIALSPAVANALLAAAEGHRLYALFFLAVTTGLRQAELLGLRWSDLNLDGEHPTLRVRQQLKSVSKESPEEGKPKTHLVLKKPKSKRGIRVIGLDVDTVTVLRTHLSALEEEAKNHKGLQWATYNLVFPSTEGTPIHASNITNIWTRIRAAISMPHLHFHDLRHTAGSLMLKGGMDIADVSAVLGHASVEITARTYLHDLEETRRRAVACVTAQLRNAKKEAGNVE